MTENSPSAVAARPPWQFQPGRSPNPGGRPRVEGDVRALAQKHGPEAIRVLVECLKSRNERVRVAAASVLLDRAYGRAPQALSVEGQTPSSELHLLAATAVSHELIASLGQRTIDGQAVPAAVPTVDLDAPLPLE